MKNILMIDIETTGTKPGCKVLSLGAFGFNTRGQQVEFYKRFDIRILERFNFTDSEDTMKWWNKQSPEAYNQAFGGKDTPTESLNEFEAWFIENFYPRKDEGFSVWSCGIDFDFPILKEFFERFGFCLPWGFWLQNDYRTLKNMFPQIVKAEGNVEKHTALEDCKAQMRGLRSFYKTFIEKV